MAHELAFSEWQYPRVASFLPLILLIPAVWLVGAPFNTNIGALVGLLIAGIATFMKLSNSKHIKVSKDSLELGSAIIPREFLGEISEISKSEQFYERGARLDARAFVFIKYGLPEMVKIDLTDPDDPTPYLLISTRNAAGLRAALN